MPFNPNDHMMKLKGKDYLQVAWRLVWFREDHPAWSLETAIIEMDDKHAIFKATICDETGVQKSAGHGSESARDFGDFLEKAETKAVGRALAMLGYGTQFAADELDEGSRIVDSPINRQKTGDEAQTPEERRAEIDKARARTTAQDNIGKTVIACDNCGKPIKGIQLKDKSFMSPSQVIDASMSEFNGVYCAQCQKAMRIKRDGGAA